MNYTCTKCDTEKDVSKFCMRPSGTPQSWCKKCQKEWAREYRKTQESKRYCKDYQLQYSYGITLEDFEGMLREQDYSCAICGIEFDTKDQYAAACVDHDHAVTDRIVVRGLLCHRCNHGLGHFKDNAEFLRKAAEYIEGE